MTDYEVTRVNLGEDPASGEDSYLRVLFPHAWKTREAARVDRELKVSARICHGLWAEREALRAVAPDSERRRTVGIVDPLVGPVDAVVCLDCRWVAWGDTVRHPPGCLTGAQKQDSHPAVGHMRVSYTPRHRTKQGWRAYHQALHPPCLARAFVHWKRTSAGVGVAERLWIQRSELMTHDPGSAPNGAHVGVVLDAVPEIAYPACLGCRWLGTGVSMHFPGCEQAAAGLAVIHATEANRARLRKPPRTPQLDSPAD